MINETEVKVEEYEEMVGNLNYTTGVEVGQNVTPFQEPTPNKNISFLAPQDRPTLWTTNASLACNQAESIPEVYIMAPHVGREWELRKVLKRKEWMTISHA